MFPYHFPTRVQSFRISKGNPSKPKDCKRQQSVGNHHQSMHKAEARTVLLSDRNTVPSQQECALETIPGPVAVRAVCTVQLAGLACMNKQSTQHHSPCF
jgi:hypothetical protein